MSATSMMVVERRHELARLVRDEGRVVAIEAAKRFGVSEDSIRRDLRALAADGVIQRVRGGALPAMVEAPFATRARSITPTTGTLAAAVASRIEEIGGIAVLDNGSTSLRIAERLTSTSLTIVTSSPAIAAAASANGLGVVMLGGVVVPEIGASVDATAIDTLRRVRADVSVLGACTVDSKMGVSSGRADEIAYKRAVVEAGAALIVAATTDKLGAAAAFHIAALDEITSLFTEPLADPALLAEFRGAGVEVRHD